MYGPSVQPAPACRCPCDHAGPCPPAPADRRKGERRKIGSVKRVRCANLFGLSIYSDPIKMFQPPDSEYCFDDRRSGVDRRKNG